MERYEGLKKYKNFEEYAAACERMKVYLKQYKWITETNSPYEDIRSSLEKCISIREKYENPVEEESSAQKESEGNTTTENSSKEKADEKVALSKEDMIKNEGEILSLKMQYEAIKSDTYISKLKRNITALYLQIGEYEARMEPFFFRKKKNKLRNTDPLYTSPSMRRFRFFMANITGVVPGEVNTNMEDRKEIPLYIMENYDLVNVPENLGNSKETALTVVLEVDFSLNTYNWLFVAPVNGFLASYGIKEKSNVSDNIEKAADVVDVQSTNANSTQKINKKAISNDLEQSKEQTKEEKEHSNDEIGQ